MSSCQGLPAFKIWDNNNRFKDVRRTMGSESGSTQLAGKKNYIYIYTQRCHSWQQPSCVGVAQFRWLGKAKTRSSSAGLAKLASNFCLNTHTVSKCAKEPKHSETQKNNDTPLLKMDRWGRGCDWNLVSKVSTLVKIKPGESWVSSAH